MVDIVIIVIEIKIIYSKEWVDCFETPIDGVIFSLAVRLRRRMDRLVSEADQPVGLNSVPHSSAHQALTIINSTQYEKLFHNTHDMFGF